MASSNHRYAIMDMNSKQYFWGMLESEAADTFYYPGFDNDRPKVWKTCSGVERYFNKYSYIWNQPASGWEMKIVEVPNEN